MLNPTPRDDRGAFGSEVGGALSVVVVVLGSSPPRRGRRVRDRDGRSARRRRAVPQTASRVISITRTRGAPRGMWRAPSPRNTVVMPLRVRTKLRCQRAPTAAHTPAPHVSEAHYRCAGRVRMAEQPAANDQRVHVCALTSSTTAQGQGPGSMAEPQPVSETRTA